VTASKNPTIIFELPIHDSIDNYILVKMDKKKDRRELEISSTGGLVGGKSGVRAEDTIPTAITELGGSRFKMVPVKRLKEGAYILYVVGSADSIKGVYGNGYDFNVD
jgi:hypothetical protein